MCVCVAVSIHGCHNEHLLAVTHHKDAIVQTLYCEIMAITVSDSLHVFVNISVCCCPVFKATKATPHGVLLVQAVGSDVDTASEEEAACLYCYLGGLMFEVVL